MAVAKAGSSPNLNADLNRVHITRKLADGRTTTFDVNLYQELQGGDISKDVQLQKNDVVYVPQARKGMGNYSGYYILLGLRRLLGIPF